MTLSATMTRFPPQWGKTRKGGESKKESTFNRVLSTKVKALLGYSETRLRLTIPVLLLKTGLETSLELRSGVPVSIALSFVTNYANVNCVFCIAAQMMLETDFSLLVGLSVALVVFLVVTLTSIKLLRRKGAGRDSPMYTMANLSK